MLDRPRCVFNSNAPGPSPRSSRAVFASASLPEARPVPGATIPSPSTSSTLPLSEKCPKSVRGSDRSVRRSDTRHLPLRRRRRENRHVTFHYVHSRLLGDVGGTAELLAERFRNVSRSAPVWANARSASAHIAEGPIQGA